MRSSVYSINKGVNASIEFKGLKAQYIWYLGAGLIVLLVLFATMYVIGVNTYICLLAIALSGAFLFSRMYKMSNTYGEHGMMKRMAKRLLPKVIKCNSRKQFLKSE